MKLPHSILFIVLALSYLSFSCEFDAAQKEQFITIVAPPNQSKDLKLSNLFEEIDYIPLASDSKISLISQPAKVVLNNTSIYILDKNIGNVMCFDRNGVLGFTIRPPQHGPEQMVTLSDMEISHQGKVLLLDHYAKKLNIYDSEGKFQEQKDLPVPAAQLAMINENQYFFFTNNFPTELPNKVFHVIENEVVNSFLPKLEFDQFFILLNRKQFSDPNKQKQRLFNPILNDTLYEVSSKGMFPKYHLDLQGYWIKDEILNRLADQPTSDNSKQLVRSRNDQVHLIPCFGQNKNFLYFTYWYEKNHYWNFYDKKSEEVYTFGNRINDIDQGLVGQNAIWPLGIYEDQLYFLIQAGDILADLNYKAEQSGQTLEGLMDTYPDNAYIQLGRDLEEYDNPVVAIATLKEEID